MNERDRKELLGMRGPAIEQAPTLRDQFAMVALTGILANPKPLFVQDDIFYAIHAYRLADAMLAARQAQGGQP